MACPLSSRPTISCRTFGETSVHPGLRTTDELKPCGRRGRRHQWEDWAGASQKGLPTLTHDCFSLDCFSLDQTFRGRVSSLHPVSQARPGVLSKMEAAASYSIGKDRIVFFLFWRLAVVPEAGSSFQAHVGNPLETRIASKLIIPVSTELARSGNSVCRDAVLDAVCRYGSKYIPKGKLRFGSAQCHGSGYYWKHWYITLSKNFSPVTALN